MTDEEAQSQRQRAFALIADARKRVNPTTTEHIAETAKRHSDSDLQAYVEFLGWKELVYRQEDDMRARFRPHRSGHANASGRYRAVRASILEMPERIGEIAKPLGELDLSEVQTVILAYQTRAAENEAEAERLMRIAEAMKEAQAATVADLGEERVFALYTAEAQNV